MKKQWYMEKEQESEKEYYQLFENIIAERLENAVRLHSMENEEFTEESDDVLARIFENIIVDTLQESNNKPSYLKHIGNGIEKVFKLFWTNH